MADLTQTRMTVQEFLKLPKGKFFVELMNGRPVTNPAKDPSQPIVRNIAGLVKQLAPPGKVCVLPTGLRLDDFNFVEPDVFFVSDSNTDCSPSEDGYWRGSPDFIVEILSRRTPLGLMATGHGVIGQKYSLYEQYGVREFWVVVPHDGLVMEVRVLQGSDLIQQGLYFQTDTFTSPVLGGHRVDVKSFLEA